MRDSRNGGFGGRRNDRNDRHDRGGFRRGGGFGGDRGPRRSFGHDDRGDRPMYDAVCENCGKNCKVPFRPTGEKPVYCDECFAEFSGKIPSQRGYEERSYSNDAAPKKDDVQLKVLLESMSKKLDQVIGLLELIAEKKTIRIVGTPAPEVVPSLDEMKSEASQKPYEEKPGEAAE